jgi:cation diffusion facilitator CzcD-associated flavoprotein CzcO
MSNASGTEPHATRVVIVGSGFSGVAMAIALRKAGITDVVILERAASLGGTWRDNAYPGCACDVESVLYSLSIAPNPDWSRTFSPQPEIRDYLDRVARDHDVVRLIRFNENVTGASFDERSARWTISASSGDWTADALVLANGALSDPRVPDLPGLSEFAGPVFHTAQWDHRVALAGKRVAVIGTGASAIQVIPAIQPLVSQLTVFQRTPSWVMWRHDRPIPRWQRTLFRRVPLVQRALRFAQYLRHEFLFLPFRHPWARRIAEAVIGRHLTRQVRDPALREALTPHYAIGCKRLLLSDDYYPAMAQPNVSLVTGRIARIAPQGVVTSDGRTHDADVLVLATGFRVTDWLLAPVIRGRGGRTLADAWQGSPKAYMGTTVAGFPNLFTLMGPNTGLGHSSVLMMVEAQIRHTVQLLAMTAQRGARAAEPTPEAQDRFVRWMDKSLATTVWNRGGCSSWYLDRTGRNSTLWPFGVGKFRRTVSRVRANDYEFSR